MPNPYRSAPEMQPAVAECVCATWARETEVPIELPHHPSCPESAKLTPAQLADYIATWFKDSGNDSHMGLADAIEWAIRHHSIAIQDAARESVVKSAALYADALERFWRESQNHAASNAAAACAAGIRALGSGR